MRRITCGTEIKIDHPVVFPTPLPAYPQNGGGSSWLVWAVNRDDAEGAGERAEIERLG
jgi:hypothetical protein